MYPKYAESLQSTSSLNIKRHCPINYREIVKYLCEQTKKKNQQYEIQNTFSIFCATHRQKVLDRTQNSTCVSPQDFLLSFPLVQSAYLARVASCLVTFYPRVLRLIFFLLQHYINFSQTKSGTTSYSNTFVKGLNLDVIFYYCFRFLGYVEFLCLKQR